MSYNKRWTQYLCSECQHVNFMPQHGENADRVPCAHCGKEALNLIDPVYRVEMPKFKMGSNFKPTPQSSGA